MILVDANLLLYAVNSAAAVHPKARTWLDARLSAGEPVGFAWPVILAFLRIATHPSLFPRPLSPDSAVARMSAWLAQPAARILEPGRDHWEEFGKLVRATQSRGNLVQDAHLAALAIEQGATLYSSDADFSRFPGLRWVNPLEEA